MEFTERMERGRDAAAAKRHRGISTGKAAAGWNAKPRPADLDCGDWHYERERIGVAWRMCQLGALEIYERMVFPERFREGVTLDEMVAARIAAELDAIPF